MKKAIIILLISVVMIESAVYLDLPFILKGWLKVHLLIGGVILLGIGFVKILEIKL